MRLYGIDFTSAPRRAKPITVAGGQAERGEVRLETLERCADWPSFEAFLTRPGPWLGAFDFPFGLPREAVSALGWPTHWPTLVRHCRALGREGFRAALDGLRQRRPPGQRYAHRATDHPARSHSPLKLVNPPVGLMFLEGAPRLLEAGLHLPALAGGDGTRIALEAYPALLARRFTLVSYKSDERRKQTPERRQARQAIVAALTEGDAAGTRLAAPAPLVEQLIDDPTGDSLDACLALLQAGAAWARREADFGLPSGVDPLEGWILGVEPVTAR